MKFIGRIEELQDLNQLYKKKSSQLVVIYGRRRVGKSRLVEQFVADKPYLRFEGIEHARTNAQINQFIADLAKQLDNDLLRKVRLDAWPPIFDYLTDLFDQ